MSLETCSFQSCSAQAKYLCKCTPTPQYLCDAHIVPHKSIQADHSLVPTQPLSLAFFTQFPELDHYILVGSLNQEAYLFKLDVVDIPLPKDYQSALLDLSKIASQKILKIQSSDQVKIKRKISGFISAINGLFLNIKPDEDELIRSLSILFDRFNSNITQLNIDSINNLLDRAKSFFNMKETSRKKLIFSVNLTDERQRFIENYINSADIDMKEFTQRFMKLMKYFIKDKKDFSTGFAEFEYELISARQNLRQNFSEEVKKCFFDYISSFKFCRVAVFAGKISENFRVLDREVEWKLMASLVLEKGGILMDKPVEISDNELLIAFHLKEMSFIIYYSSDLQSIVHLSDISYYKIVAGSFNKKVFFLEENTLKEFSLINNSLVKNEKKIDIKQNGEIDDIVYIKDTENFVYIANYSEIFEYSTRDNSKKQVKSCREYGKLLCSEYCPQKKIVCIKSEKYLLIFNSEMEFLFNFKVFGRQLTTVFDSNDSGVIILIDEKNLIEIRINDGLQVSNFIRNDVRVCQYSARKTFCSGSFKYKEILDKSLNAPDRCSQILEFAGKAALSLTPSIVSISRVPESSQQDPESLINQIPNVPGPLPPPPIIRPKTQIVQERELSSALIPSETSPLINNRIDYSSVILIPTPIQSENPVKKAKPDGPPIAKPGTFLFNGPKNESESNRVIFSSTPLVINPIGNTKNKPAEITGSSVTVPPMIPAPNLGLNTNQKPPMFPGTAKESFETTKHKPLELSKNLPLPPVPIKQNIAEKQLPMPPMIPVPTTISKPPAILLGLGQKLNKENEDDEGFSD